MARLYLHIGRGKTGTTQAQRYLAQIADALSAQGVHYVRADGGQGGHGHQQLAKSFVEDMPRMIDPARDPHQVRAAVQQEIASTGAETVILSSENFAIADPAAVRAYLDQAAPGYAVTVIFFARSQDELAESEYNQIVKLKRETRSLMGYVDHEMEGLDFMQTAQDWEAVFGRAAMCCRIFDARGDSLADLLACMPEIDSTALPPAQRHGAASDANASVGIRALEVARILNSAEIEGRRALYTDLFARLAPVDLPAVLLSSAEARALRARFAASNRAFTQHYLGAGKDDLGGRRYSDGERDALRAQISAQDWVR